VEYVRDTFRWSLRESSVLHLNPLHEDHHGFFPSFDLGVAMRYAHDSNIPEMVQVIFYTAVLHDAAKLGSYVQAHNGLHDVGSTEVGLCPY